MSAVRSGVPAPHAGEEFVPGRLVDGRYVLLDQVGRGTSCTMWRARDEILRRDVAIKRLVASPLWTREQADAARARAHREGRVAARLHHPRLASIYDLADVDGDVCLVMEYVDAPSLARLLEAGGPLAVADVARMGAQLADGLTAAHAAGVLHRDVKPANVLVGAGGAILTDFGVARLAGDPSTTDVGLITGTPHFMAPEVARGAPAGSASDVYSLGATLFTALEGHPPTGEGTNALDILRRVAACQNVPPRRAGVLAPALARLLDPDPAHRPAIGEVAGLLRAAAGSATATATVHPVDGLPPAPAAGPAGPAKPATLMTEMPPAVPAPVPAPAPTTTPPVTGRAGLMGRPRVRRIAVGSLLGAAGVAGVLGGVIATTTASSTAPTTQAAARSAVPAPLDTPAAQPAAPMSAPPIVPPADPPALDIGMAPSAPSLAAQAVPPSSYSAGSDAAWSDDGFGGDDKRSSHRGTDDSDHSDHSDHSDDGGHQHRHGHGKDHGHHKGHSRH